MNVRVPCPSHPLFSCRVHERGLLSPSAPHFLLEEAQEQSLGLQEPPGFRPEHRLGGGGIPCAHLLAHLMAAARRQAGWQDDPSGQAQRPAEERAGDGGWRWDWDGPGTRTAVGTLTKDAHVGAQRGGGGGELC